MMFFWVELFWKRYKLQTHERSLTIVVFFSCFSYSYARLTEKEQRISHEINNYWLGRDEEDRKLTFLIIWVRSCACTMEDRWSSCEYVANDFTYPRHYQQLSLLLLLPPLVFYLGMTIEIKLRIVDMNKMFLPIFILCIKQ